MKIGILLLLTCQLLAVDLLQPDRDGVIRPKWDAATIQMPTLKNGVDVALPHFEPVAGMQGINIKSVGSDAVNNIMALTGELIQSYYKDTKVEIEGKGGATAPAALGSGWANIGPMSRQLKEHDLNNLQRRDKHARIIQLPIAIADLTIFVHKDNPIKQLTIAELAAMYSEQAPIPRIQSWPDGALGEVKCYSRNTATFHYGWFRRIVLNKKEMHTDVIEVPGSSAVMKCFESHKNAIGYASYWYKASNPVRIVPVAKDGASQSYTPDSLAIYNGNYPLQRLFYLVFKLDKHQPLDPALHEYLRLFYHQEGQAQVQRDGYITLPEHIAKPCRDLLKSLLK